MNGEGQPERSDYIIELYSEASELWDLFRSSQKPEDLRRTATLLCDGLGGLQEDPNFWAMANNFANKYSERHAEIDEVLSNIDRLLALVCGAKVL